MHVRREMVAREGQNSVNVSTHVSTQSCIAVRYAGRWFFCSSKKSYHLDETINQHESIQFSIWEKVCRSSREKFQLFSKGILDPGSLFQLLKTLTQKQLLKDIFENGYTEKLIIISRVALVKLKFPRHFLNLSETLFARIFLNDFCH